SFDYLHSLENGEFLGVVFSVLESSRRHLLDTSKELFSFVLLRHIDFRACFVSEQFLLFSLPIVGHFDGSYSKWLSNQSLLTHDDRPSLYLVQKHFLRPVNYSEFLCESLRIHQGDSGFHPLCFSFFVSYK